MALPAVLVVIGTRPEAIKLAPVVQELRRRCDQLRTQVCLSGQHRELIAPLVSFFELSPDFDLALMSAGQTPASFAAAALPAFNDLLQRVAPTWIIVQGDTSTAATAALAAYWQRREVLHVEAGLRSGTLTQPWPEEFNRRLVSLAASYHAAPTRRAAEQLHLEGVAPERVQVTGNTVIDTLQWSQSRLAVPHLRAHREPPCVLITAHRRENLGPPLRNIVAAIRALAAEFVTVPFVWPVHPHPEIYATIRAGLRNASNVQLVQPLDYPAFVALASRARLLISDSGGLQEEAPALRTPLLVLRTVTERPEALESGIVTLVGTQPQAIIDHARAWLTGERMLPSHIAQPFGDGSAARQIVDWLVALNARKA